MSKFVLITGDDVTDLLTGDATIISKHDSLSQAKEKGLDEAESEDTSAVLLYDLTKHKILSMDHDNRGPEPFYWSSAWTSASKKDKEAIEAALRPGFKPKPRTAPELNYPDLLACEGDAPVSLVHFSEDTTKHCRFFALNGKSPVPFKTYGRFGTDDDAKVVVQGKVSRSSGKYIFFDKNTIIASMKDKDFADKLAEIVPLILEKAKPMNISDFLEARKFDIYVEDSKTHLTLFFESRPLKDLKLLINKGLKAVKCPKKLALSVKDIMASGGNVSDILSKKCKIG